MHLVNNIGFEQSVLVVSDADSWARRNPVLLPSSKKASLILRHVLWLNLLNIKAFDYLTVVFDRQEWPKLMACRNLASWPNLVSRFILVWLPQKDSLLLSEFPVLPFCSWWGMFKSLQVLNPLPWWCSAANNCKNTCAVTLNIEIVISQFVSLFLRLSLFF